MGHVVDGSSERDRHALSIAHTVVWLADVLSIEMDSFVADDSWVFASCDGGDIDSGWGEAVVRVGAAASGDSWVSSWDLGTVSVVSSESESKVAAHSNWGTVVDSSVLSVDNRVQGSTPSVAELVSSSVVAVLWNGDSRVATELWTLSSSVWINAEIVVTAASVDSSEDGSAGVGDSGLLAHCDWVASVDGSIVNLVGEGGGEAGGSAFSLAESIGRVGDWNSVDPDSSVAENWVLGGRDGRVVDTSEDVWVVDVAVVVSRAAVDFELIVLWWIVGLSLGRGESESSANVVWHACEVGDLLSVGIELQTSTTPLAVHLSSEPRGSVVESNGAFELLDWVDWWDDGWIDTLVLAVTGTSGDEGSWDSTDVGGVDVLAFVIKIQSGEDIDWVANEDLSPDIGSVVDSANTSGSAFSRALRESSSVQGDSVEGDSLVTSLVVLVPWSWSWWVGNRSDPSAILLVAAASLNIGSLNVGTLVGVRLSIWEDVITETLWHAGVDSSIKSHVDSRYTSAHISWRAGDGVSGSKGWGCVVGKESNVAEDVVWSGRDRDWLWDVLLEVDLVTFVSLTEARCLKLTAGAFLSLVDECHDLVLFACQQNESSGWRRDRLLSAQSFA